MRKNSTEARMRDAMTRLLEGHSGHTDGRLTVANLALEAGISRATANRCSAVLDPFRRAVSDRREAVLAMQTIDREDHGGPTHVFAQHVQARAMLRRQEERRASRADVLPFPRQQTGDVG